VQARQDVVVPMRSDGRQQLGRWLIDAERQFRLALEQAEASLDDYRRALVRLGELRYEVESTVDGTERPRPALRSVDRPATRQPASGVDYWREPVVVSISREADIQPPSILSPREEEVLSLLARGKSNKEIAGRLSISVRTVERHINNIYRKIGVQNRTEATLYALRRNRA